jgi:hypothetical protein
MDALPWIAAVDKFQHWIYLNPEHTVAQRYESWSTIMNDFGSDVINYQGLEANLKRRWQIQLHLFEVPFYYIEYGFAQLGAIAMWRNYKTNAKRTIDQYRDVAKRSGVDPRNVILDQDLLTPNGGVAQGNSRVGTGQTPPPNALEDARAAIAKGAPRDKVIERLRQNGIPVDGL